MQHIPLSYMSRWSCSPSGLHLLCIDEIQMNFRVDTMDSIGKYFVFFLKIAGFVQEQDFQKA